MIRKLIFLVLFILIIPFVSSATNNPQTHNASHIYPQIFTTGNYSFLDNVSIGDTITGNKSVMSGNSTADWFQGLFNWTIISDFFTWTGSILGFNSAKLNNTIRNLPTGNSTLEIATVIRNYPTGNTTAEIQTASAGSGGNTSKELSSWFNNSERTFNRSGTIIFPANYKDNLNVTGNITSENVFYPQYIYAHTDKTIGVAGANIWTNMTFDEETTAIMFGISHTATDDTNETFMVMEDGIYDIDYDFDLEDTSPGASDINVAGRLIFTNGSEVIGSVFETDIVRQGAEAELTHNFLARCKAGDSFKFQFVASDADVQVSTHGTFGDHPESATILMMKVANI